MRLRGWRRTFNRVMWGLATVASVAWLAVGPFGNGAKGLLYLGGAGVLVQSRDGFEITFAVGHGWPNRAWLDRGAGAAPGEGAGGYWFGYDWFGVGSEGRRWNGNVPIVVRWYGVRLPGPYCLLIAIAPVAQQALRRLRVRSLRARRQSRLERWGERCAGCGYDLRASETHCPECGSAILPQALMMRARRRQTSNRTSPPPAATSPPRRSG